MNYSWIDLLGYAALTINLISMSMGNVVKLRTLSLIANSIYVIYGILLGAFPLVLGGSIAVCLHAYHIYKIKKKQNL